MDIVALAGGMVTDSAIYSLVVGLADTLSSRGKDYRFTGQQRADLANRLRKLSVEKFPDGINIKHQGYRVAAEAQVARVTSVGSNQWSEIIDKARAIQRLG